MKTKKYIYWTVGILGLVAIGVAANFYYEQSRPLYCLKQAHEAYETHNLPLFKRYVQVESIVDNMVDQVMEQTIDQTTAAAFTNTETDMQMGSRIVSFLKPMFTETLAKEVYQMVERPVNQTVQTSSSSGSFFSVQQFAEPFLKHAYSLKEVETVEIKGDKAYLTLVLSAASQPEKPIHVQAVMSRTPTDDWQLTALPNLATLLNQLK